MGGEDDGVAGGAAARVGVCGLVLVLDWRREGGQIKYGGAADPASLVGLLSTQQRGRGGGRGRAGSTSFWCPHCDPSWKGGGGRGLFGWLALYPRSVENKGILQFLIAFKGFEILLQNVQFLILL